jgi:hypothetical protein
MSKPAYKLSDELIGQVAKLLQMALLTGTSIVDNLRLVRVTSTEDESEVVLAPEYKEYFDNSINQLVDEAETLKEEMQKTPAQA